MTRLNRAGTCLVAAALALSALPSATAQGPPVGIVVMHGKAGLPTGYVAGLASALEAAGYLVANPEMPWSGRRNYDVPVSRAEEEVDAAVKGLRSRGAAKVFVAGHSQGGLFALHVAGRLPVDGAIAIAPGGSVVNRVYQQSIGDSLARARRLVAEGRGGDPVRLEDYEGSRGTYPVVTSPSIYLTWFEPGGAMNMERAARAANPGIPILWLVPTRELPALRKINLALFTALPSHSRSRLVEPDSDHVGAPSAAIEDILRWLREVAGTAGR